MFSAVSENCSNLSFTDVEIGSSAMIWKNPFCINFTKVPLQGFTHEYPAADCLMIIVQLVTAGVA